MIAVTRLNNHDVLVLETVAHRVQGHCQRRQVAMEIRIVAQADDVIIHLFVAHLVIEVDQDTCLA